MIFYDFLWIFMIFYEFYEFLWVFNIFLSKVFIFLWCGSDINRYCFGIGKCYVLVFPNSWRFYNGGISSIHASLVTWATFQRASARVVPLATTDGAGVFPRLLFCIEIFRFLPDVLARRYIFKWLRNLPRVVGWRKKSGKGLRRADLWKRYFRSFLRAGALVVPELTTDGARFHDGS